VAKFGEQAVVLGASMGGLLAARVLADSYRTVIVVERDVLPTESAQRRGVPQGRHIHVLWPRGSEILEGLFPGFLTKLVSDGSIVLNDGDFSKLSMSFGGHQFVQSGTMRDLQPRDWVYYASRPFLEDHVRQRVRAIPNVTLMEGHDVVELTSNADRTRVTGALVTSRDGGEERPLTADLVVDATGRGSRTPAFLDQLGYDRPVEQEVVMRLAYVSQLLRMPPGVHTPHTLVGPVPGRPTGMGLFTYENSTWLLTVFGLAGIEPPTDPEGMLQFIEDCTPPQVLSALRQAEPLGEVTPYRTPCSRWRRYDKMRRFPAGLLVFGDAICSFNPIYGQGMTVAALQALALDRCLSRGADGLAARWFRAAAKPIGVAWQLAVGGDLSLPEIEGPRPLATRLTNRYVDRIQAAAEIDPVVASNFLKVAGFGKPPASLMYPSMDAPDCCDKLATAATFRRPCQARLRHGKSADVELRPP
jgi:2-polyprenyl-6-methoxyphenol hydroxylase-like FAD-dependent oxidoreductase